MLLSQPFSEVPGFILPRKVNSLNSCLLAQYRFVECFVEFKNRILMHVSNRFASTKDWIPAVFLFINISCCASESTRHGLIHTSHQVYEYVKMTRPSPTGTWLHVTVWFPRHTNIQAPKARFQGSSWHFSIQLVEEVSQKH